VDNIVKISIIIPNLNSPIINQTIDSFLHQISLYPFEIIVVGIDKYNIIEKYSKRLVRFIETDKPTPPAIARNLGANTSTGDLIIFIDADCVADKNFVEEHVQAHNGNQEKLVGGAVRVQQSDNYWILSDNISTFHEILLHTKAGKRDILPSLNLSVSHSLWEKLGGFDPKFPTAAGEDADFSYRARQLGADLIFNPRAIVEHHHQRGSLKLIINHAYNFGKYSIKLNPNYRRDLKESNFFQKNPLMLILFSPLIALTIILKIVVIEKLPLTYWHTLPIVFIAKIAWCFGAFNRIITTKEY